MTVLEAIERYLTQEKPEPHLVIQETDLTKGQMLELGFDERGEYWVIDLEGARRLLDGMKGVDYAKHWEWERTRDDFRLGAGG